MSDRKKIIDKAKKLKELSERGIDGEKDTAKVMYDKYVEKHKITEEEINENIFDPSMFNGMTDEEFIREVSKELIKTGLVMIFSAFAGSDFFKTEKK
jgi:hypothetical protein